eukprot:COSAG01_NODE_27686_length_679_cov_1.350000_1_plen_118_part_00
MASYYAGATAVIASEVGAVGHAGKGGRRRVGGGSRQQRSSGQQTAMQPATRSAWGVLQHTAQHSAVLQMSRDRGPGDTRVSCCWIDQQAAKLTPSKTTNVKKKQGAEKKKRGTKKKK